MRATADLSLEFPMDVSTIEESTPIMAMTTRSSIRVKPFLGTTLFYQNLGIKGEKVDYGRIDWNSLATELREWHKVMEYEKSLITVN